MEILNMNKSHILGVVCTFLFSLSNSALYAAPVNLNNWTAESYPAVSGFPAGSWAVQGGGSSVVQSNNGQPTFFYSDFDTFGSKFTGDITSGGGDDDYIGFALGFNPGDSTNGAADYLLIDWKAGTQGHNFSTPSNTPGSTAFAGLAVSRVTGIPTADEFWGHVDFSAADGGGAGGLQELARGNTLGATGWSAGATNEFTFDFGPTDLDVYVNSILELSIMGSFNDGRFGFYNFSQAGVTYAGFEKEVGTFPRGDGIPPVPVPAAVWLFGTALIGFIGMSRRTKVA
jgi:hypothetical protein